jgi:hypothetical protein
MNEAIMENNFQEMRVLGRGFAVNICIAFLESDDTLYIERSRSPTLPLLPLNPPHAMLIEITGQLLVFTHFLVAVP